MVEDRKTTKFVKEEGLKMQAIDTKRVLINETEKEESL